MRSFTATTLAKGGVKVDEKTEIGLIVKWKLFSALFIGFILLGLLVTTIGITNTAFGLPIGGMGKFYVAFDRLEGTGFLLNSTIEERSKRDQAPLVHNEFEGATVYGLHIYKDLQLPMFGWVRLNIKSSEPTTVKGLVQEAQYIQADVDFANLGMTNVDMTELSAEEPFWGQSADAVSITNATMVANYLFQDIVSLKGMTVSIEKIDTPTHRERLSNVN